MDFKTHIKKTVKISNKFSTQFDQKDRILDLVEEVGELAQAMLMIDKRKVTNDPKKQRTKEDIADALADILFNNAR